MKVYAKYGCTSISHKGISYDIEKDGSFEVPFDEKDISHFGAHGITTSAPEESTNTAQLSDATTGATTIKAKKNGKAKASTGTGDSGADATTGATGTEPA